MSMDNEIIAEKMERHAADFGLALSTIGQNALSNPRAYDRIKNGTASIGTARRMLQWLDDDRAKREAAQ